MTIKLPPRGQRSGPIYQAIADAIGREIEAGRLKPGGRLPTQRVLARQLGVTLTTVTRAYVEAQRRGLLNGEVGRGTFVRPSAFEIEGTDSGVLDLAVNSLMPLPYMEASLTGLPRRFDPRARIFGYHNTPAPGTTGPQGPRDCWTASTRRSIASW
jgi:DNA-binding transcriptional regulator YhcF (GntR family)